MINIDNAAPPRSSIDTAPLGRASEAREDDAVLVILRWHRASAWAWMTRGHGPTSRFAGFVRLGDPVTLAARLEALGWRLLAVRDRPGGFTDAEIQIPLPRLGNEPAVLELNRPIRERADNHDSREDVDLPEAGSERLRTH